MRRRLAPLTMLAAMLALPACGLQPLYAGGGDAPVARALTGVTVASIGGRSGWLMRNALIDRLQPTGTPTYRLEVELSDQIAGFGVRSDNAVTRERRTLRARYRLVDAAAGTVLLDATAGSDAGVDVVSSEYATIAAEQTALENLTQDLGDTDRDAAGLVRAADGGARKVKGSRAQIERALDAADPGIRLYLLYGPDDSGSVALAARLGAALGADGERIDLAGATLKGDPARLADEAAGIAMFGGRRWIRVSPAGDEVIDAVDALLAAPVAGNPAVLIAGALRKDAKLLKRVLDHPAAMAFASYPPEGAEADRLAIGLGRALGLEIRPDVAHRLAAACAGDRALLSRELEKFADYLDAVPGDRKPLDHMALDLLGADSGDADLGRLVDAVLGGAAAAADAELARLAGEGTEGVPVVRALQRRLLMLAEARATGAAPRGVFWKEKDAIDAQLARWDAGGLATALSKLAAAGRATMTPRGPGPIALDAALSEISRAAARRR